MGQETDELLEQLLLEIKDHLDVLSDDILLGGNLSLEDSYDEVFRRIHSVKGLSQTGGFSEFADQTHKLEDFLILFKKDPSVSVNPETLEGLLEAYLYNSMDYIDFLMSGKEGQFPLVELNLELFQEEATKPQASEDAPSSPTTKRVLIVDDEEDVLETLSDMISLSEDIETVCFNSAVEALQFVIEDKQPVDLIITDYNMPSIHGGEFICQVRQSDSSFAQMPMILLSGYRPNLKYDTPEWEDVFFLEKPLRLKRLTRYIHFLTKNK